MQLSTQGMNHTALGRFLKAGAFVLATALAGCSAFSDEKSAKQSPAQLYQDAKDDMAAGSWDSAIKTLEKLEGRAAGTILAQQAQIEKAYAQYRSSDQETAKSTLERFVKEHPASPAMDYALYLKGLINFNDDLGLFGSIAKQDLAERDQKASKDSYDAFKDLTTRFPDSKYTADAKQRMAYIVNSLAQYEVHVARYYFTRGAYVAAVNRAQTAVTDYPKLDATEEALYLLVRSYDALGLTRLRDDSRRVLEANFPKSAFLARGLDAKKQSWLGLW